jgi:hypothetical protein
LSINDIIVPQAVPCNNCGTINTFNTSNSDTNEQCIDLGQLVGDVTVSYIPFNELEGDSFTVKATYDGVPYNIEPVSGPGSFTFYKNKQEVTTMKLNVISNSGITIQVESGCVQPQILNLVEIVLTNNYDSSLSVHTQYRYTNGAFVSPLQSNFVSFAAGTQSPLVSRYNITTGFTGSGSLPPIDSTMRIISNRFQSDTFNFNAESDSFKYCQTDTLYGNNSVDLLTLLSVSTLATPNQGGGDYNYAEFTVPGEGLYLYLIWDFRSVTPVELCYSDISKGDVCCNC